ncbi:CvpA family protein [Calycomorphotria hydatis]|uniref:Colicin V production protein n=1 Tax=Calycomorphotria hydatis TaxID=2528027 RepID=A0A517TBZ8_9PLAN|nr:CvpA family protein [Calycomorphotria hydatis]QDT65891.1 hypothetical protein V22_31540 [Calycomorphotria hydatis]
MIIDLILVAIFLGVTWCVASGGASEAAMTYFTVLFAGIISMNYFEPLAQFLDSMSVQLKYRSDMIAMLLIFGGLVFGGRALSETLAPRFIHVHGYAHEAVRWLCASATGFVTIGVLLTALHTAPMPLAPLGFRPGGNNIFDAVAPDRYWLGFTQYITEKPFSRRRFINGEVSTHLFDGRTAADWGVPADAVDRPPHQIVMPSFIIRYRDRRQMLQTQGAVTNAPPKESSGRRTTDF